MNFKICSKCKRTLPADLIHFNKRSSASDGLHSACKECRGHKFRVPYNYGVNTETERKCSVCNTVYPKTNEYFTYEDKAHTKLQCVCKRCAAAKQRKRENRKEYYYNYIYSHPEVDARRKLKRSLRLLQNGGTFTLSEYKETLKIFDNSCAYCGSKENLSRDHVVPITKGGKSDVHNIIPACLSCNSSKSNMDFQKWFKTQPFYSESRESKIINFTRGD